MGDSGRGDRGYSLTTAVEGAERDIIRESTKIENENRQLLLRIDTLEEALGLVKKMLDDGAKYQCIELDDFDRLQDIIEEVL